MSYNEIGAVSHSLLMPGSVLEKMLQLTERRKKDAAEYAAAIDAIIYAMECYFEKQAWKLWIEQDQCKKVFYDIFSGKGFISAVAQQQLDDASDTHWLALFTRPPVLLLYENCMQRLEDAFVQVLFQWQSVLGSLGHDSTMSTKIVNYQQISGLLDSLEDINNAEKMAMSWLDNALRQGLINAAAHRRDTNALEQYYTLLKSEKETQQIVNSLSHRPFQSNKSNYVAAKLDSYRKQAQKGREGLLSQRGLFKNQDVFALCVEGFYAKAQRNRLAKHKQVQQSSSPTFSLFELPRLQPLPGVDASEQLSPKVVVLDYDEQTQQKRLPAHFRSTDCIGILSPNGCLNYYPVNTVADECRVIEAFKAKPEGELFVSMPADTQRVQNIIAHINCDVVVPRRIFIADNNGFMSDSANVCLNKEQVLAAC